MVVLALCAAGFWLYWIGWPWWQAYRELARFEESVKQLKAGSRVQDIHDARIWNDDFASCSVDNAQGRTLTLVQLEHPLAFYGVCFVPPRPAPYKIWDMRCERVEVFRLPPMPRNYQPKTELGRKRLGGWRGQPMLTLGPRSRLLSEDRLHRRAYWTDFMEVIAGRAPDIDFEYELIHRDPPATEGSKP